MGRLDGKVAYITGAARGQGRSHAVRMAKEGADVILLDSCAPFSESITYVPSTSEDLQMTVKLVSEAGGRVLAEEVDVRDFAGQRDLAARGVEEFGHIDIVVANAGICSFILMLEITEDHWREILDVNLTGAWNTIRATLPHMLEEDNGGSVIITSSAAGIKGMPYLAHYSAAKHGVVGLMKTCALEYAQSMIRFNTVHPTGVNTTLAGDPNVIELIGKDPDFAYSATQNPMPIPYVEPEDVSDVMVFLASDEAQYITGHAMTVDGGFTIK